MSRKSRSAMLAAAGAAAAIAAATLAPADEVATAQGAPPPNVVVIQTDDQTVEQLRVMRQTRALIGAPGATFRRHYVNWPVCCPSRATLLTGQYAHNHGVLGNTAPNGGYGRFDNANTTAVWLQRRGYVTAHIGKFLNGYGSGRPREVPQGWDEWYTGTDGTTQQVYGYTQNENGTLNEYGTRTQDFKQDVYTDRAVQLISEHVGAGRPLYLELDYSAPHGGGPDPLPQPPADCENTAKPAPRHAHAFDSAPVPRFPGFNEADVSDKPKEIRNLDRLDESDVADIDRRYRCRLESLLSVDEGVAEVIAALRAESALSNTYVIFTSDNGFFHGEHRVPGGKSKVYEPSSRVPLLIRGPGVPGGTQVRDLTTNADVAATVVEATGAQPTHPIDGRSLLPFTRSPTRAHGRELLIETNSYTAIVTQRYVWVEHADGDRELYDMYRDPFQLESRHGDPAYARARRLLAARLAGLRQCEGRSCRLRPQLELRIDSNRTPQDPPGCVEPPVRVQVRGGDTGVTDAVVLFVRGERVATDRSAPFERSLTRRELAGPGDPQLRVVASLADGRLLSWERSLELCR